MIAHVFVLLLVAIVSGSPQPVVLTAPFPTVEECKTAAAKLNDAMKAHPNPNMLGGVIACTPELDIPLPATLPKTDAAPDADDSDPEVINPDTRNSI